MQSMPLQTLYSKERRSIMRHKDKVIECIRDHCSVPFLSVREKSNAFNWRIAPTKG